MGIEYESVVQHPIAEVFAWHSRPGAMPRLVPPWQPMEAATAPAAEAGLRVVNVRTGVVQSTRWLTRSDAVSGRYSLGTRPPSRGSFSPHHRRVPLCGTAIRRG